MLQRGGLALLLALGMSAGPTARAHVADVEDWSRTYRRLVELFPRAAPNRWKILRYREITGPARKNGEMRAVASIVARRPAE